MAKRRIIIQDEAVGNIEAIRNWIADRSYEGAANWFDRLLATFESIRTDPLRFGIAAESSELKREVRQASFRMRSRRTYRILFLIDQDDIHILYVRAPGQDTVDAPD